MGLEMGRAGLRAAADAPAAMQGAIPLLVAAVEGHSETVKALVELGATVDARTVSWEKGRSER